MAQQSSDHQITTSLPPEMSARCSCGATSGPQSSSAELQQWVDEHTGDKQTQPYWAGV
ncbi:MAG: hypothetical protein ACR2FV_18050 [Ornithinimicrobium sp.]|jgi:hypothetical protein|uniref:hypothetical protein n=1 Tax=Ornithinimicrobium sp. TaxID=1977084 RepID=UPI003D9B84EF